MMFKRHLMFIWHLIIIQRCPKNMCGELMFPNWKCRSVLDFITDGHHVWAVDREAHHMMDLLNQVMRQVLVQCRSAHRAMGQLDHLVPWYQVIYLPQSTFGVDVSIGWFSPMIIIWGTWPPSLNIFKVRQALGVDKSVSLLAICSGNLQQL